MYLGISTFLLNLVLKELKKIGSERVYLQMYGEAMQSYPTNDSVLNKLCCH
jgi:hypothetical protein